LFGQLANKSGRHFLTLQQIIFRFTSFTLTRPCACYRINGKEKEFVMKKAVRLYAEYFYFVFKGYFSAYYFSFSKKYNLRVAA